MRQERAGVGWMSLIFVDNHIRAPPESSGFALPPRCVCQSNGRVPGYQRQLACPRRPRIAWFGWLDWPPPPHPMPKSDPGRSGEGGSPKGRRGTYCVPTATWLAWIAARLASTGQHILARDPCGSTVHPIFNLRARR